VPLADSEAPEEPRPEPERARDKAECARGDERGGGGLPWCARDWERACGEEEEAAEDDEDDDDTAAAAAEDDEDEDDDAWEASIASKATAIGGDIMGYPSDASGRDASAAAAVGED
jgi:hypothetical protein